MQNETILDFEAVVDGEIESETTLRVRYSYEPGHPGVREGLYGPQVEPAEPASVAIETVILERGETAVTVPRQALNVLFGPEEWEALERLVLARHEGQSWADYQGALELRREAAQ